MRYLVSVVRGRRGVIPGIMRAALAVLSLCYVAGLKLYLLLYRLGIRRATRLPCSVICVGNLSAGGTGKTPTTQLVCRLLTGAGKRVAVIIRGYGGKYERRVGLASDGENVLLSAQEAGDEAYLLARTLPGIAVAVGRDRVRTGRLVCEMFRPDVIVMDDGMQHWRLHRDLDIVLLNACKPFDNGWTVPRGMLREPKSHLRRAGIVLLTNSRRAGDQKLADLRGEVAKLAPGCPIFEGDLSPVALLDQDGRAADELEWLNSARVGAMCALGNPSSFESMLGEQGAIVASKFRFPDHYAMTRRDIERVFLESAESGAEAVVTTEKDAVKMPRISGMLPLRILRVAMIVSDEPEFAAAIAAHLDPASGTVAAPRLKLT